MDNNYEQTTGTYGSGTEISTTPQYGLDNAKSNDTVNTLVKVGVVAGLIIACKKGYDGLKTANEDRKRGKEARLADEAAKTAPAQNVVYVQTPAPAPQPAPAPAPEAQPEANANTNKK